MANFTFSIPYEHIKFFSKNIIITRGLDGCLFLCSEKVWKKISQNLESQNGKSRHVQRYISLFITGAEKIKLDENKRLPIPDYFQQYAEIKKEVIFLEFDNHIEIWAREKFEKYRNKFLKNPKVISAIEIVCELTRH